MQAKEENSTMVIPPDESAYRGPGKDSLQNKCKNYSRASESCPFRNAKTFEKINEANDFEYLGCCLHQNWSQMFLSS